MTPEEIKALRKDLSCTAKELAAALQASNTAATEAEKTCAGL